MKRSDLCTADEILARGQNLIGNRYGRRTVMSFAGVKRSACGVPVRLWNCKCDCGALSIRPTNALKSGDADSCGCLKLEQFVARNTTHALLAGERHPLYSTWIAMKERCLTVESPSYHNYGGRGIRVCDRWEKFENFVADMGERPTAAHSIERNDNDGNYTPDNCRWATKKEQASNTRRNVWIEFNGERKTMMQWSESTGLSFGTLRGRLDHGWTPERMLTTPSLRRPRTKI